ncbi:response regulator transcription factor, partial [bacterium]
MNRPANLRPRNRTTPIRPASGVAPVTSFEFRGLTGMRPPAASPIRVLLAHEDPLFVEGMVSALQQDGRFAVVGAALDGRDLARQTRALRPSIVVLDVNFPGFGGRAALPSLRRASQQTRVIVMARSDRGLSREVVRAGARGFLLMNSPPPTFRQAVA